LSDRSKINQLSRYVSKVDGKIVDFSSAVPLARQPADLDLIKRFITGWLGKQAWVLKTMDCIQNEALNKVIRNL
jgi:hypothetical protein